ncbi:MAG: hypothetical protein ABL911_09690 [Gallionella sp.]
MNDPRLKARASYYGSSRFCRYKGDSIQSQNRKLLSELFGIGTKVNPYRLKAGDLRTPKGDFKNMVLVTLGISRDYISPGTTLLFCQVLQVEYIPIFDSAEQQKVKFVDNTIFTKFIANSPLKKYYL